ncbi:MAG: hypothetical protein DRO99_02900 [Candidatus Aenigmatarchaeota archaeon]|nr:MAG: hypothetical protein DRO99_02900 [Candidatus Aenigmarchaeota archaeon]
MDAQETLEGVIIEVRARPGSPRFMLHRDGRLELRSQPEKGKANREALKELGKLFGCRAELLSGTSSRRKRLLLKGLKLAEFRERLNISLDKN